MKKLITKGIEVIVMQKNNQDYISLTNIAQYRDAARSDRLLQNWMRTLGTVEFLGLWEKLYNPDFKPLEFEGFKTAAGEKNFSLTPKHWIRATGAIGMITKSGRHGGGTFAHKDIAFEFASWISAEFKLYLIKEFQRLKEEENERLVLGWDAKRMLAKINYKIHTDAIAEHLVPATLSTVQVNTVFANEADVLNMALFGMTAKQWRNKNSKKKGNLRDYANVAQLVCLANLESLNAEFIRQRVSQKERLLKLNEIAIIQLRSLVGNATLKKLT